ncbi:unnamed protein product [Nesidiocoris tenuis]|uniref:Ribosome biogenesis protein BMS1/TSR1 C-terminal domain-containing protein n=1 Tax=Nesidiocoris tenuis TaxID=355587 RepID=A0A6H5HTH5_9HEMI|nr:unnamed protein product [Nesidiocoris tenuis]
MFRPFQLNRKQFEDLDDSIRVEIEGYRAGLYVRLEISNMPCELVDRFDPTYPIVIGGLQPGEQNVGYVKVMATGIRLCPQNPFQQSEESFRLDLKEHSVLILDSSRVYQIFAGRLLDLSRRSMNPYRNHLTSSWNSMDSRRKLMDSSRNLMDSSRHQLDSCRNLMDSSRNLMDSRRNLMDSRRNLKDSSWHHMDSSRNLMDSRV